MWQRSLSPSVIRFFYRSKTVIVKPLIHGIVRFHVCGFNVCHGPWIQNQELMFMLVRGIFSNNVDFFNNFTMLCSIVIKIYPCVFQSFCHLFAEFGLVLMTLRKIIGSQRESLT